MESQKSWICVYKLRLRQQGHVHTVQSSFCLQLLVIKQTLVPCEIGVSDLEM